MRYLLCFILHEALKPKFAASLEIEELSKKFVMVNALVRDTAVSLVTVVLCLAVHALQAFTLLHCESKKQITLLVSITSQKIKQFSKIFYC